MNRDRPHCRASAPRALSAALRPFGRMLAPLPPPPGEAEVRFGVSRVNNLPDQNTEGEVAAAEPPRTRRNGSLYQIKPKTRAEPLAEGVEALPCEIRLHAAAVSGSWNPLNPLRRLAASARVQDTTI